MRQWGKLGYGDDNENDGCNNDNYNKNDNNNNDNKNDNDNNNNNNNNNNNFDDIKDDNYYDKRSLHLLVYFFPFSSLFYPSFSFPLKGKTSPPSKTKKGKSKEKQKEKEKVVEDEADSINSVLSRLKNKKQQSTG